MGQCNTFLESDDFTDIILKCIEYKTIIKTVENKNSFPSLGVTCFYNFPFPMQVLLCKLDLHW